MPVLTFPIRPDGYELEVWIGLGTTDTKALQGVGMPVPPLRRYRGLIDSGSDATAVVPAIPLQFNLTTISYVPTTTASGQARVRRFFVTFAVEGPTGIMGPSLIIPDLKVTELAHSLPNIDVLIGRDVLRECLFLSDGPSQRFTLAF